VGEEKYQADIPTSSANTLRLFSQNFFGSSVLKNWADRLSKNWRRPVAKNLGRPMTAKLIRSMPDLVQAIRARIEEIGLTYGSVDELAGLADGYTAKILCGMKNPGAKVLNKLCDKLAIGFVPVIDEAAAARMAPHWIPRKRPLEDSIPRCLRGLPPRYRAKAEPPKEPVLLEKTGALLDAAKS